MSIITIAFNNYRSEAVVVVQNGEVIGTLPPMVPVTYTSTPIKIDPIKEVIHEYHSAP